LCFSALNQKNLSELKRPPNPDCKAADHMPKKV
jgi:hypothetical protein